MYRQACDILVNVQVDCTCLHTRYTKLVIHLCVYDLIVLSGIRSCHPSTYDASFLSLSLTHSISLVRAHAGSRSFWQTRRHADTPVQVQPPDVVCEVCERTWVHTAQNVHTPNTPARARTCIKRCKNVCIAGGRARRLLRNARRRRPSLSTGS